jgi:hypothetical protein
MDAPGAKRFRQLARYLKAQIPERVSVRVMQLPVRDHREGDCRLRGGHYLIRVSRALNTEAAMGVLLHEFAHVLCWGLDGDKEHGEYFKKADDMAFGYYRDWLREET